MSEPLQLLAGLVSIPSLSGDEGRAADALERFGAEHGLATQRKGNNVWYVLQGRVGPRLLLHSHIDTVPPGAGWQGDPWLPSIEAGRLTGLGANDAKGCVAAILSAVLRLQRDAQALPGTVLAAITAEEETGGAGGITSVVGEWGRLDAAVFGEPTGLAPCTAQGGMLLLSCTSRGDGGHVAHAGALGLRNAIHIAAADITRLAQLQLEPYQAFDGSEIRCRPQVTMINGGVSANQSPDTCEFRVDLRTTPNLDHVELLAQLSGELASEVTCHSRRYRPVATASSEPVAQAALAASGKPASFSRTVSDWPLVAGIPAVKIGPGQTERSHQPNEFIFEHELLAGVDVYERLVRQYFDRSSNG